MSSLMLTSKWVYAVHECVPVWMFYSHSSIVTQLAKVLIHILSNMYIVYTDTVQAKHTRRTCRNKWKIEINLLSIGVVNKPNSIRTNYTRTCFAHTPTPSFSLFLSSHSHQRNAHLPFESVMFSQVQCNTITSCWTSPRIAWAIQVVFGEIKCVICRYCHRHHSQSKSITHS